MQVSGPRRLDLAPTFESASRPAAESAPTTDRHTPRPTEVPGEPVLVVCTTLHGIEAMQSTHPAGPRRSTAEGPEPVRVRGLPIVAVQRGARSLDDLGDPAGADG